MESTDLQSRLFGEICRIPVVDTHSHIDALRPAARTFDELLGYHYYTELAHSCGRGHEPPDSPQSPRERCRSILSYFERFDNTVQANWLLEIARQFFGFRGERLTTADSDSIFDAVQSAAAIPDWTEHVAQTANLECVFLTNAFDDPLTGFDRHRFVPCLRTDDLVFQLGDPALRGRLAETTGIEANDVPTLRTALGRLVERFATAGAKACAVSLPPRFTPSRAIGEMADTDLELNHMMAGNSPETPNELTLKVFWMMAQACREFGLPFDLMIGVNRRVYSGGVFQGQDLFDSRTSLLQFADLFNAFPTVRFPVSVLAHAQAQELAAFGWLFPNVFPHGHWWYSNVPAYIGPDLRARLTCVPRFKLLGYYSDAYKLEFALPKFNMYRRELARILAEEFVRPGRLSESGAVELAGQLLRDNPRRVFNLQN